MDATGLPNRDGAAAAYREQLALAASPPDDASTTARLGRALRRLAQATVGSNAPDELLAQVADAAEEWSRQLEPHAAGTRFEHTGRVGGPSGMVNHPMIGVANPCAPPIVMRPLTGEHLIGDVEFGTPQEGPPGYAYGGYIAAGFDAILLMTAGSLGVGGPTRSLTVRYRRPTPLNAPLRYEGGIEAVEERVTRLSGRLMAGDVVCAEGTAEVARAGLRRSSEG